MGFEIELSRKLISLCSERLRKYPAHCIYFLVLESPPVFPINLVYKPANFPPPPPTALQSASFILANTHEKNTILHNQSQIQSSHPKPNSQNEPLPIMWCSMACKYSPSPQFSVSLIIFWGSTSLATAARASNGQLKPLFDRQPRQYIDLWDT